MTATGDVRPSREFDVDGQRVAVFDGLLPDAGDYARALDVAAFKRTEVARADTAEYRHWAVEIALPVLIRQAIYEPTCRALASWSPGTRMRPYRAYTNVALYGDMLFSHVDCLPGAGEITALWYLAQEWETEWGGETLFFDRSGEIACAVRPRPGRLVLFDGEINHVGRPPNRICYRPRYTLAIKFERAVDAPG